MSISKLVECSRVSSHNSVGSILLAFGVSFAIGVSSVLPARKAAALDPLIAAYE